jgi:hypothetical protein
MANRASQVQFRGVDQVVRAYRANAMAACSIWADTQMMFAYENDDLDGGEEFLCKAFEMLKEGESEGLFTLKVYEGMDAGKIKSNTPYSRSFKFSLYSRDESGSPYQDRQKGVLTVLEARFSEMQATFMDDLIEQMQAKREKDEQPEKIGGLMGLLNGFLDNPQVQTAIAGKVLGFLNINPFAMNQNNQPAKVAGTSDAQVTSVLTPDQTAKVQQALTILCQFDANLGDNLLKIAAIARDSPLKYRGYTALL